MNELRISCSIEIGVMLARAVSDMRSTSGRAPARAEGSSSPPGVWSQCRGEPKIRVISSGWIRSREGSAIWARRVRQATREHARQADRGQERGGLFLVAGEDDVDARAGDLDPVREGVAEVAEGDLEAGARGGDGARRVG